MKKSLFAVAAATAFTGAAQAQSSVSVYGILDVGYNGVNERLATNSGGVQKATGNAITSSSESGSRLGFRGTEDLGGGTRASFVFELGINPANQSTWGPNVRQAFVGLGQKGIGNLTIGTQNTIVWQAAAATTTGQLAQTMGSVLAPTYVGPVTTLGTTSTSNAGISNTNGNTAAFVSRTSNTLQFATDRFAGLVAKAQYTLISQDTNRSVVTNSGSIGYTGGNQNQSGWGLAVDYVFQKLNVQAAYQSFKAEQPYQCNAAGTACTTGAPLAWGNQNSNYSGINTLDNTFYGAAVYDFGILKAYAGYVNRKVSSSINSNQFLKRTAQEIGVRGNLTKTIEGWASVGNGRYTGFGTSEPTANITGYQVGSNYWMSKRTNLYAIYGQNGTSSTTTGSFNVSNYSLGVRHTF
jgi:predicted porin